MCFYLAYPSVHNLALSLFFALCQVTDRDGALLKGVGLFGGLGVYKGVLSVHDGPDSSAPLLHAQDVTWNRSSNKAADVSDRVLMIFAA